MEKGRRDKFFISAAFPTEDRSDIDIHDLELFAWDETKEVYNTYAAKPFDEDFNAQEHAPTLRWEVQPSRCDGCHLSPAKTDVGNMPFTPIMNELTRPWTHWEAAPSFASHKFIDVDHPLREAPDLKRLGFDKAFSVANFENIIREGYQLSLIHI